MKAAALAGGRIKTVIQERELSQKEVAEAAGVDPGQFSKLLNGLLKEPNAGMIFDICRVLDIDPAYVWNGVPRARLQPELPAGKTSSTPPASNVRQSSRPRK